MWWILAVGLADLWGIADLPCWRVESTKWLKHKLRATLGAIHKIFHLYRRRGLKPTDFMQQKDNKEGGGGGALCVKMDFTWTFPRNQDATVKLKSELISIKF